MRQMQEASLVAIYCRLWWLTIEVHAICRMFQHVYQPVSCLHSRLEPTFEKFEKYIPSFKYIVCEDGFVQIHIVYFYTLHWKCSSQRPSYCACTTEPNLCMSACRRKTLNVCRPAVRVSWSKHKLSHKNFKTQRTTTHNDLLPIVALCNIRWHSLRVG
jgi:hypothetical protein